MYKFIKNLFCFLLVVFAFTACRKQAYDDYYGRPASLAPPIYQVLQARGNFTNLLAVIDKAGYKSTLSGSGYWTMFAPNDDAFKKYFTANGITGVDQISAATAIKIVTYCMVYNASATDHISDYQSPTGYIPNIAYKRVTTYHEGADTATINIPPLFQQQQALVGQKILVQASNRNGSYLYGDFNNKAIPYFTSAFLGTNALTATDYNYFFPNSTFSGFNVVDGSVINKDISCENGVVHEINSVILPLPNLDQYLAANKNYSRIKQLLERYMVYYVKDANATHLNQVLTGSSAPVYIKTFVANLAFSPNNENFLKIGPNDAQINGYTLFAPTNNVVDQYLQDVILEHYPFNGGAMPKYAAQPLTTAQLFTFLDKVPGPIIVDFLNSHMFPLSVWPTKFASTKNTLGDVAYFDAQNNVIDKKLCSNGFFYGTNKVEAASVFSTVYGRPYLDTAYSLMTTALNSSLKFLITIPTSKYTMFMVSNSALKAAGYDYSTANSAFTFTAAGVTTIGGSANDNMARIISMCIAATPNGELNDLSGQGIFETGRGDGTGGEYLKYNANKIFAAGNVDAGNSLTITSSVNTVNGKVYYTTGGLPMYSILNVGIHISQKAVVATDPYYNFFQYLKNSGLYNAGAITGVQPGVFYTILIPSNAAILQAVKDGILPATTAGGLIPNYAPTVQSDIDKVNKFIQYHIIKATTIVTDGKKSSPPSYPVLLNDPNSGNPLLLQVTSGVNSMKIIDNQGRTANVVLANSNVLSNYTVIHQIDNYLNYN